MLKRPDFKTGAVRLSGVSLSFQRPQCPGGGVEMVV
jgi:hypothetical protein